MCFQMLPGLGRKEVTCVGSPRLNWSSRTLSLHQRVAFPVLQILFIVVSSDPSYLLTNFNLRIASREWISLGNDR